MGKKHSSSAAFFLLLNILFFSVISASPCSCPPAPSKPKPTPKPTPKPSPKPTPSGAGKCPKDALKLGVCANVLGNLIKGLTILHPLNSPCCSLLTRIADLEAAVCLCTAIKANLLGINLNVPLSLTLLLNVCNKKVPPKFKC